MATANCADALRLIERKRFNTLQAAAALSGITLHQLEDDHGAPIYIATRWAMTKQLSTLDEVALWLERVTGRASPCTVQVQLNHGSGS